MNNLITIENVKGYLDPVTGTAYLNAEDVARGFGFTTVAKSGNAVIRWARVNRYLSEFGLLKEISRFSRSIKRFKTKIKVLLCRTLDRSSSSVS